MSKKKEKIPFAIQMGIFWLSLSLLIWFSGIGGRDLYLAFVLPGLIFIGWQWIYKNQPLTPEKTQFKNLKKKHVLFIYFALFCFLLITAILKFYSFRWHIWDVGSYSSAVFNMSKGLNYNSFVQAPALADHFIPGLAIFVPFYKIEPTALWLIIAKVLSYAGTPFAIYWWLGSKEIETKKRLWLSIGFGIAFLFFYQPAVSGRLFEFSPSALAPPFIVSAFMMMEQRKWIWFAVFSIFLLSLKEHTGVVLIGFGIYQWFHGNKKTGFLIAGFGLLITYSIVFHVVPYFRGDYPIGNSVIAPLKDISGKLIYLLRLFWPLGFLPVIFWRQGLLAFPAISVNLISGRESMHSISFHYDDLSSTLLLMAVILILIRFNLPVFFKRFIIYSSSGWKLRCRKTMLLAWFAGIFILFPRSPGKDFFYSIPKDYHQNLKREIEQVDARYPLRSMALQSAIGPHILRVAMGRLTNSQVCTPVDINEKPPEMILLSGIVGSYPIKNIRSCIQKYQSDKNYTRLSGYQYLIVFRRNQ